MSDSGLCKIDYTKDEIGQVVAFYDSLVEQLNECNEMIGRGAFGTIVLKKFLFFSWKSNSFDKAACESRFGRLFDWARWWEYDDDVQVWASIDFEHLQECVKLLKTRGDVYFPPHYCTAFRRALILSDSPRQ